jgi:hypothetical protein
MHGLILVFVVTGAGLRLWQYFANTAMWLDEIRVAQNVLDRSPWDLLTTPLTHGQVAPKGFLLAEKAAASLISPTDHVLKLFPLVCSLVALVAFWRVAELVLEGLAVPIALALFATAAPLVIFASEAKQYSSDVAVAVLLLWLALDLEARGSSPRRVLWTGVAGAVLVWFSLPAVLMLFALGASLALIGWRGEAGSRRLLALTPMLGMWGTSALAATFAGLASMTPATREYMHRFWAAGFLPIPPLRGLETFWPWHPLTRLIGTGGPANLAYPAPALYLAVAVLGFWVLWRRNRSTATLLLAPIGVTLAAAVAHQYPFSDRLILFLVPSFFVAIGACVEHLRRWAYPWSKSCGVLVPLLLVGPALYPMASTPPVYRNEDVKPVLSYMQANRRAGDGVYVYYGAGPAVTFYGEVYGLREDEYVVGLSHRGDGRCYFEELDMFRGRPRLWVVLTHTLRIYPEREDILRYLDTIGVRRDVFAVQSRLPGRREKPAEVFLYDLSDPVRLSSATAISAPLTGPSQPNARKGCGKGPQATVPLREGMNSQ